MLPNPFEDPVRRRKLIGCGMAGAMTIAPFLALPFGVGVALVVMAFALAGSAFAAFDLVAQAPGPMQRRIRLLARACIVLAALCLVAAIAR